MTTEYDNSKHNTASKIESRNKLVKHINDLASDYNKYWTLCNKIVGSPNEFTQIMDGTHFEPSQFFAADYDVKNIEHNRTLNLGANFFEGDFLKAYFDNTSKNDKCVINLDGTWYPDRASKYVEELINLCYNKDYYPPIVFVNTIIKHKCNSFDKRRFVDLFNSPGWTVNDIFGYENGKSTMHYNICFL